MNWLSTMKTWSNLAASASLARAMYQRMSTLALPGISGLSQVLCWPGPPTPNRTAPSLSCLRVTLLPFVDASTPAPGALPVPRSVRGCLPVRRCGGRWLDVSVPPAARNPVGGLRSGLFVGAIGSALSASRAAVAAGTPIQALRRATVTEPSAEGPVQTVVTRGSGSAVHAVGGWSRSGGCPVPGRSEAAYGWWRRPTGDVTGQQSVALPRALSSQRRDVNITAAVRPMP